LIQPNAVSIRYPLVDGIAAAHTAQLVPTEIPYPGIYLASKPLVAPGSPEQLLGHGSSAPTRDFSSTSATFGSNQSNHKTVRHLLLLALGIETAIGCHQSLQALPGIGDRACNTEVVG
jgi:hypothetical protein